MANGKLVIDYKLFFEADDVAQTRILSSESYIKKSIAAHKNRYIAKAKPDSETDLDEFLLRLYYDEHIEEEECTDVDAAEGFLDELAALLTEIARMQSYLDMEGSFSISFAGEQISYHFESEAGDTRVLFEEQ
ncbi:MAG: hypothetical protein IKL06_06575 [Lachnospiraceae bacterium]|nr:hypothetical protein [Lachnospiraceae bacterium]